MRRVLVATIGVLCLSAAACERPSGIAPASLTTGSDTGASGVSAADIVLAEVTTGTTGTWNHVGQSVTIPGRGAFNRIRFNWIDFAGTASAFGTLYLLDREYLGTPPGLSNSTPGFIAKSEGTAAGQYVFHQGVVLRGGSQYWFYTDTMGSLAGSFDTDIYAGGDMYVSGFPTVAFRKAQASGRMVGGVYVPPPPGVFVDANFRLHARSSP
jgi:hypothetical protein